jgi:hypothetical protein
MVMAPALLTEPGIGPISAAQLLISWSHPGRFRSEAAFAMLAGAAPVPASSGQVVRHRLNRGRDRQLNRALHTIVMSRQVHHGPTRASTSRRIAQGKSQREMRRCLKRTLARQLYRLLERTATSNSSTRVQQSRSERCPAAQPGRQPRSVVRISATGTSSSTGAHRPVGHGGPGR